MNCFTTGIAFYSKEARLQQSESLQHLIVSSEILFGNSDYLAGGTLRQNHQAEHHYEAIQWVDDF